ncbi:MAG: hypothetical protein AAGF11_48035 [Myxococcota bacterium]
MAYEAEIPSPTPAATRKRVILLCCEDLRPIACSLEEALRGRGWDVRVEFGADARPWVQKTPPQGPSLRVLCVPGTVDRRLVHMMRAALAPDPDADLHILGVDDSPGLVQEIERLAGVVPPPRRSLHAPPRLGHATMIETTSRRERGWLVGTTAALSVVAIALSGVAMAKFGQRATRMAALPTTSISVPVTKYRPAADPRVASIEAFSVVSPDEAIPTVRSDDPVFSAVATPSFEDWEPLEPLPEEPAELAAEDERDLVIEDDAPMLEPHPVRRAADVAAPPLAERHPAAEPEHDAQDLETDQVVTPTTELTVPALLAPPAVAVVELGEGPPLADRPMPEVQLPAGFLPVAGLTAAPAKAALSSITVYDPFEDTSVTATTSAPFETVDPFASPVDTAAP